MALWNNGSFFSYNNLRCREAYSGKKKLILRSSFSGAIGLHFTIWDIHVPLSKNDTLTIAHFKRNMYFSDHVVDNTIAPYDPPVHSQYVQLKTMNQSPVFSIKRVRSSNKQHTLPFREVPTTFRYLVWSLKDLVLLLLVEAAAVAAVLAALTITEAGLVTVAAETRFLITRKSGVHSSVGVGDDVVGEVQELSQVLETRVRQGVVEMAPAFTTIMQFYQL